MRQLNGLLDRVRDLVRLFIRGLASLLNDTTRGRLTPNTVTLTSLAAHVPIALAIASGRLTLAAILLALFGLFDTLDGELARLQKRAGSSGMLLDAVTDRMKEVVLYMGIISYAWPRAGAATAVAVVAACGGSLLVSYTKAKGETAVGGHKLTPNEINRLFQDGLMRYEVRMALLVAGLFFEVLMQVVFVIALTAWVTAIGRLARISKQLRHVQG